MSKIIPQLRHFLVAMLLCLPCQANEAEVTGVSFSTSNSIAPYFSADGKNGIQYELLKAALEMRQMTIAQINLAPNWRALRQVNSQASDCLINAPNNLPQLYYTQSLIDYQNSVFSLSERKLVIDELKDLQAISLVGFQNASLYLGKAFAEIIKLNANYVEVSSQRNQVAMLYNHRIDAIVMERRIFNYYREQMRNTVDTEQSVTESTLFRPAARRIACRDAILASKIDEAIHQLKQSKKYTKIMTAR